MAPEEEGKSKARLRDPRQSRKNPSGGVLPAVVEDANDDEGEDKYESSDLVPERKPSRKAEKQTAFVPKKEDNPKSGLQYPVQSKRKTPREDVPAAGDGEDDDEDDEYEASDLAPVRESQHKETRMAPEEEGKSKARLHDPRQSRKNPSGGVVPAVVEDANDDEVDDEYEASDLVPERKPNRKADKQAINVPEEDDKPKARLQDPWPSRKNTSGGDVPVVVDDSDNDDDEYEASDLAPDRKSSRKAVKQAINVSEEEDKPISVLQGPGQSRKTSREDVPSASDGEDGDEDDEFEVDSSDLALESCGGGDSPQSGGGEVPAAGGGDDDEGEEFLSSEISPDVGSRPKTDKQSSIVSELEDKPNARLQGPVQSKTSGGGEVPATGDVIGNKDEFSDVTGESRPEAENQGRMSPEEEDKSKAQYHDPGRSKKKTPGGRMGAGEDAEDHEDVSADLVSAGELHPSAKKQGRIIAEEKDRAKAEGPDLSRVKSMDSRNSSLFGRLFSGARLVALGRRVKVHNEAKLADDSGIPSFEKNVSVVPSVTVASVSDTTVGPNKHASDSVSPDDVVSSSVKMNSSPFDSAGSDILVNTKDGVDENGSESGAEHGRNSSIASDCADVSNEADFKLSGDADVETHLLQDFHDENVSPLFDASCSKTDQNASLDKVPSSEVSGGLQTGDCNVSSSIAEEKLLFEDYYADYDHMIGVGKFESGCHCCIMNCCVVQDLSMGRNAFISEAALFRRRRKETTSRLTAKKSASEGSRSNSNSLVSEGWTVSKKQSETFVRFDEQSSEFHSNCEESKVVEKIGGSSEFVDVYSDEDHCKHGLDVSGNDCSCCNMNCCFIFSGFKRIKNVGRCCNMNCCGIFFGSEKVDRDCLRCNVNCCIVSRDDEEKKEGVFQGLGLDRCIVM